MSRIVLTERDQETLKEMVRWYERQRGSRDKSPIPVTGGR